MCLEKIRVKYFKDDTKRIAWKDGGDWIDLSIDRIISINQNKDIKDIQERFNNKEEISFKAGDSVFVGLGLAVELPKGYEANVLPRSSMFKKTGLLLTNSMGIIDNAYCGDEDEWKAMLHFAEDGKIKRSADLLQFKVVKSQPKFLIEEVEHLGNENRGGFGSTDKKEEK